METAGTVPLGIHINDIFRIMVLDNRQQCWNWCSCDLLGCPAWYGVNEASVSPVRQPLLRPRAFHIGAGNIGRGFIGKLLAHGGCAVIFADVLKDVVEALKTQRQYSVRVVGATEVIEQVSVEGAIDSTDLDAVVDEIAKADIITTAVGPRILERIAPTLLKGLQRRMELEVEKPVNIIACENTITASSLLKGFVLQEYCNEQFLEWLKSHVGFVNCAVDRIVPPPVAKSSDVLAVTVEEFNEWIIDESQIVGPVEIFHKIPGLMTSNTLNAFVERKLMTVNTGHAITAYLGHLYGLTEIGQAIANTKIRAIVKGAMRESGGVLAKRFGFDPDDHEEYIAKVISRYENSFIRDEIVRVAREPQRKLGPNDRLVKPLLGTCQWGLPHDNLVIGIAAALLYNYPGDPDAQNIQSYIKEHGIREAVQKFTSIDDSGLVAKIIVVYDNLVKERST